MPTPYFNPRRYMLQNDLNRIVIYDKHTGRYIASSSYYDNRRIQRMRDVCYLLNVRDSLRLSVICNFLE